MNLDSLEASGLDPQTYFLARLAALVAMDAAPVSYVLNLGLAADSGVTFEQVQGVLIGIAPMVGSARVASAAGKILRGAFGVAVALDEEGSMPEQRQG
jgi:4-carboxymuconolactone decarboxylase